MWRIEGERLESCIKRREAVFQRERIPPSIDRNKKQGERKNVRRNVKKC